MKTSSCKAKGRRACQEVKELLCKYAPDLNPDNISITPSGCTGEDVVLSPTARDIYPFAIECKNTESIQIWKAFAQAESHAELASSKVFFPNGNVAHFKDPRIPVLFFRRNRSKLMVCLEAEEFIKMVR